jgi:hypothetical protein
MTRFSRASSAPTLPARLILSGVIVLAGATGGLVACSSLGSPVLSAPPAGAPVPPVVRTAPNPGPTYAVGDRARTGNLKVEVTSVRCGMAEVGGELKEVAKGQFCEVSVTAENVGKKKATIDGTLQKLYDSQGRSFRSSWDASYAALEDNPIIAFIKPGRTAEGVVVFDVPRDVDPETVRLTGDFSVSTVLLALP